MTHHVHPFAHRLGILRDWQSRWFARGNDYQAYLKTDVLIRKHLEKALRDMYLGGIDMERQASRLKIVIKTSRPGLIIGRSGEGITKIKKNLDALIANKKLVGAEALKLEVEEIRSPEANAAIVAIMVREGLEKRFPFRRVLKQTIEKVMANRDVQGIKIGLSGMLGGAMSRKESLKKGRVPLQTFRADVDYAHDEAALPLGKVGVKVWIYRGEVFEKDKM